MNIEYLLIVNHGATFIYTLPTEKLIKDKIILELLGPYAKNLGLYQCSMCLRAITLTGPCKCYQSPKQSLKP